MADYLYCLSNPAIPGVIRIDSALNDPRVKSAMLGTRASGGRAQRIDWVIPVAEGKASETALNEALSHHADPSWPGHFRCDPMRARAAAIQFTTLRAEDEEDEVDPPVAILPAAVLSLGLAVHFLGITNGQSGPSIALIAAALYWVVHATPLGSRDELLA